ncbi:hypothetical protein RB25_11925 [Herbaspirillum rubrisubalbicans]|nr:hypothetical protein RB25_11925 [Herbaspirillum rubrisubalbicans]
MVTALTPSSAIISAVAARMASMRAWPLACTAGEEGGAISVVARGMGLQGDSLAWCRAGNHGAEGF